MGCPGAEWVERQIPHIANDGTITVYEGWTLHHDYRFGIGLHATLDVPCLTIKAVNAFVQRFLAAEAEYANPNPISYRYHEIENWHVESNAIAVPDQYSKPVSCKDNQTFLHARFGLGDDVLKPYKTTIDRWLWPDMFKNQDTSVSKAKKAISDYKKAIGQPEGLAELMVIYCERAAGFSDDDLE